MPASKQGRISSGSEWFFMMMSPAHWLVPIFEGKYLSDYLKEEGTQLKYAGKVNLEGQTCHFLVFSSLTSDGLLCLIEEKGWAPKKLVLNSNPKTLNFNTRVEYLFSDFKQYGDITFPMRVVREMYDVYPDREDCDVKEVFTVTNLQVDTQIPDTDLFIKFPVGTRIFDTTQKKDYIVEPNNSQPN